MQQGSTNYYHPYNADDSDDTGSTGSSGSLDDFTVLEARAAGPSFSTIQDIAKYSNQGEQMNSARGSLPYNEYVSSQTMTLPDSSFAATGKTTFKTTRKDVTTLFLVDSTNRDRQAFPQPTSFTLRPPRPYKTVTSIQITQLKLLCSFFYFQANKGNIVLPVVELNRQSANIYLEKPLTKAVTIREGTYTIGELLSEITLWLNFTPLFYDYPNGFTGFVSAFTTNGDFGVNFNEPGDTFYDSLNKKFIQNPTKDYIVKAFWVTRYAGLTSYTIDQIKIAYYYPVLYQVLQDPTDTVAYPYLNLTLTTTQLDPVDQNVYTRVTFNAKGLGDPVILELIDNNIFYLDLYRTDNTFRYSLVNRYQITYDAANLRINLFTLTLNTSLLNLFTKTSATSLASALQQNGYSSNVFIALSNQLNQSQVVFNDMYSYMQSQFVRYFAIDFATYAAQYFVNPSNILFIQNGFDASNIRTGYTLAYLTSGTQPLTSSISAYSNSPGYWPRLVGAIDPSGINVSTNLIPYSATSSNFQFGNVIIDGLSSFVNTDQSTRSIDTVITIKPAKYTVLRFRSPCRQTLQVETLPLPYYYRYADYNRTGSNSLALDPSNNNVAQKYFDISYSFMYNTTGNLANNLMDQTNYSSLQLNYTYGNSYLSSFVSAPTLLLNVQSNFAQFQFTAPPVYSSTTLGVYTTDLTFTSLASSFPGTVLAFVYHDRAAFMADINSSNLRSEDPYNYIASNSVRSNTSNTLSIRLSTFTGNTYYTIFRSETLSFENISYVPTVSQVPSTSALMIKTDYVNFSPFGLPSDASNITNYPFVTNYNSNYTRLPVNSTLQGTDPLNPIYSKSLSVSLKPIGYDISGVSDDLTDYRGYNAGLPGFIPNTQFRIDPISQFTFQKITDFNSLSNSYFAPGSRNALLSPITNAPYSYKANSNSEIKIVHWYDGFSIPKQKNDNFQLTDNISTPITSSFQNFLLGPNSPYTVDQNGNIQFGEGISAIGFLPQDGLYLVSSFTFKSVIYPINGLVANTQDPNMQIQSIGIFKGSYIANTSFLTLSNSLEVLTKINTTTYAPSTLSNTPNFGVELGTYYTFGFDPTFIPESNININGYTQGSNQLLSYDSMYYLVPFNSDGSNITFTQLAGSILPYPLTQLPISSSSYFNQTAKNPSGSLQQITYIVPSTIYGPSYSNYGPKNSYAPTQSQYEQSQPITTTSIGFRNFGLLIQNTDAFYTYGVSFSTSLTTAITPANIGLNTFVSEYNSNLWIVNSLSNFSTLSNANLSFIGAEYASTIADLVPRTSGGTMDCIRYLINKPSTLQNYEYSRTSTIFATYPYTQMPGTDISTTTQSFTVQANSPNITVWLWGGGGGTNPSSMVSAIPYMPFGGAGAYVKATINVQQMFAIYGGGATFNSTISVVVGKGGNRDNFTFAGVTAFNNYAQPRYGGGGTALTNTNTTVPLVNGDNFPGASRVISIKNNTAYGTNNPTVTDSTGTTYSVGAILANLTETFYIGSIPNLGFLTISVTNKDPSPKSVVLRFTNSSGVVAITTVSGDNTIITVGADVVSGNHSDDILPQGGGFSGLFLGSNLATAIPLLVVGGGGAGGAYSLGGPGGFGLPAPTIGSLTPYLFSGILIDTQIALQVPFASIQDIDNVSFFPGSPASAMIDGNLGTTWNPTSPPFLQPYNFNPTNQTYRLNLQFSSNVLNLSRLRYYGPNLGDAAHPPTGFVVYSNQFKTQVLFSNTSVSYGNYSSSNNGTFGATPQLFLDLPITSAISPTTTTTYAGFVSVGITLAASNAIKYSIDGSNWFAANTRGFRFVQQDAGRQGCGTSVKYANGIWLAGGQGVPLYLSNFGTNWTAKLGNSGWQAFAMSASGKYQIACTYSRPPFFSSDFGQNFDLINSNVGAFGWLGAAMSATGQYIVLCSYGYVYVSSDFGASFNAIFAIGFAYWSSVAISASGRYIWAVVNNGTSFTSGNFGSSWSSASGIPSVSNVAVSGSGQYVTLVSNAGNNVWVSNNFGVSWTFISIGGFSSQGVAMSSSGRYQIANANNGIWLSSNFGVSFTQIQHFNIGYGVSISATGRYMILGTESNGWWYSSNFGVNWSVYNIGVQGFATAMSADGKYMLIGPYSGGFGYQSIATTPTVVNPYMFISTDGINWNPVTITEFDGVVINGIAYSPALGLWVAGGGAGTMGSFLCSTDGINWNFGGITNPFNASSGNIRFLNGNFFALGGSDTGGKYSTDGFTWINIFALFGYDITYGNGVYVAGGYPQNPPLYSGLIYSFTGISGWTVANQAGPNYFFRNLQFWGMSLAFGRTANYPNGVFTSAGLYGNNGTICRIYYSPDGINWYNTNDRVVSGAAYNQSYRGCVYGNSNFVCVGDGPGQFQISGYTNPGSQQTSTRYSTDAINWGFNLTGGYIPWQYNSVGAATQAGEIGLAVDYGQITIVPNLSTLYIELQKTTEYQIYAYEIQAFGAASALVPQTPANPLSNAIDNNLTTYYWPSEAQTPGLTSYPFSLNFSTPVSVLNRLQVYSPLSNQNLATSITVATDGLGPLATVANLTFLNYSTLSGNYVYEVGFVPSLSNISTLSLTLGKTTTSSIELSEVRPLFNPLNAATPVYPVSVTDLDNRGGFGSLVVSNIIGTMPSLINYWNVNTWNLNTTTQTLRLQFTFSPNATQINRMQVYSDVFGGGGSHMINGIGVYLDSTKTVVLFSNASPTARQYKNFMYYDFDIANNTNTASLYVELTKTTTPPNYQPYIYQVAFYNIGPTPGTLGGFAGGLINTILQQSNALAYQDGGGGTVSGGGIGGAAGVAIISSFGLAGTLYAGGRPAPNSGNAANVSTMFYNNPVPPPSTIIYISSAAGGGGGGYYGGGGGGTISTFPGVSQTFVGNYGGAGGGGSGFIPTVGLGILGTGGTISIASNRVFHTFTGNGVFTALAGVSVEIFAIGGGGGGGGWSGGGGGAGNLIIATTTLTAGSYTVTIGAGGAGGYSITSTQASSGSATTFGSIVSAPGGGGGGAYALNAGKSGGSGGGGAAAGPSFIAAGAAITGTTSGTVVVNLATSGGAGANSGNTGGAGGGGATQAGTSQIFGSGSGRPGGNGYTYYGTTYGGGGGGGGALGPGGTGGTGGGGAGVLGPASGVAGTPNTGGGGGGTNAGGFGGAGGSGLVIVSYTYTPLISLVEYGVASRGSVTPSNWVVPGIGAQSTFIGQSLLTPIDATNFYGGGGIPGSNNGIGAHGLVILNYETQYTVSPPNINTASTFLTDASKLSLFQAPIDTTASTRSLTFGTYIDQIQTVGQYANYNYVWYRSYLSLVGGNLNSRLRPTIGTPVFPTATFPFLPTPVFNILAGEFNNISSFYNGTNLVSPTSITDTINFSQLIYQTFFVVTPFTSPNYDQATRIYCLLDYLQDSVNLLNPHVNPANPTLDRIFGGVPGFGYWANPFLTNTSFVGFDLGPSLVPPSSLVASINAPYVPSSMQAMYGLVIEQNLSTGYYTMKDIMSFKPNSSDVASIGSNWALASQFNESFVVRNPESDAMTGYISVQPSDFKNAISGRLPLFNYKTFYTTIRTTAGSLIQSPIHMINDFEGSQALFYSYQNSSRVDYSTLLITHIPMTSTLISLNNHNILDRSNNTTSILGTAISEYSSGSLASTSVGIVNQFGYASLTPRNFYPQISIYQGSNSAGVNNNFYNNFISTTSNILSTSVNVGRLINDYNGNIYASDRFGSSNTFENVCTTQVYMDKFLKNKLNYASPSYVLSNYNAGNLTPYTDFFFSKFTNIWHLQGTSNMSTLYGARLESPFDFTITTNFINQVFYPTHKISLQKKGVGQNPITQVSEFVNTGYPSYPHTEMFFYSNYTSMVADISGAGKYANEQTSNFINADQNFSGFFFNSFINDINLQKTTNYNSGNDSYYYLAIRAFSPSEQFKCVLRMALPGRYDFGYLSLADLSNEYVIIQTTSDVNPDYQFVLNQFNAPFIFQSRTFGATGLPGYSGSNISSVQFGDFLKQYINIYNTIQTNTVIVSSVSGIVAQGNVNLITGDLQYILPSSLASRSRNQDPLQFALYLSTFVSPANRGIEQYGLGYNLGYAKIDTPFNSIQRATSFFKILDDYIYLRMNPEYNMNQLDVSRQENFSATQDPVAESQLYNCKLLLNTFGSYAQTVVQNPVFFNPPIGKLDKLSFQWYDVTGTLINNTDCEWSAVLQITESVLVATPDSTLPAQAP